MSLQHSRPGVLTSEVLDQGWVGEGGDRRPIALQAPWGNVPHRWKNEDEDFAVDEARGFFSSSA